MRPKIFSITKDDDLLAHMATLSEEEHESLDAVIGPRPKRTVEQTIGENLASTTKDMVNLPAHYAHFAIEPVRFCVENKLGFLASNVIKYTCRAPYKNGVEDYDKAIRCLWMEREKFRGNPDWWTKSEDLAKLLGGQ